MRDWFSKNLGDAMLAHELLHQFEELFTAAYSSAGKPGDMAVGTSYSAVLGWLLCGR